MKVETPISAPVRDRKRLRSPRMIGALVAGVLTVGVLTGCISDNQSTVLSQINNSRNAAGVHTLAGYGPAHTKAQNWANHLANLGYIKHSSLTSGYKAGTWCRLGENVGMGPNLSSIHAAFLNSPSHRANLMSRNYDSVGTGVAKKGNTYFVVHEFVDVC